MNLGWAARIGRAAAEPHGDDAPSGRAGRRWSGRTRSPPTTTADTTGSPPTARACWRPARRCCTTATQGRWRPGAGFGSALGVIQAAHRHGKVSVWVNETRPLLQGARLTTWELDQWGIPYTLITDSMAGHFMQRGAAVDAVIVGADRIAANGDVANKIGTYTMAQPGPRARAAVHRRRADFHH